MSEPAWTPGPWETFRKDGGRACYIRAVKSGMPGIAFANGEPRSRTYGEQEANAALIAAAPDLYDAASDLMLRRTTKDGMKAAWDKLDAVLARARGEQP